MSISVAGIILLTNVPGISPMTLFFPLGTSATAESLPGLELSTRDAVATPLDESVPRARPGMSSTSSTTATLSPAVTDLPRRAGHPKEIDAWARGHWISENAVHWAKTSPSPGTPARSAATAPPPS
ncbi:hypothetical protein [Streptomyces alkaliterrae]|uniref:Uncharacterized protein n=1 Tax=Streptomyces alkaliterrae TaxID=2213162 RepID=A0A5P0YLL7_9ACTN|nr:hypothetical protein [Streptomyces alkaliterrae]MQS00790.1 hypothetical protein [Streptomyces alkaliterrae]